MHYLKTQSLVLVIIFCVSNNLVMAQDSVIIQIPENKLSDSYFQYSNLMGLGVGGYYLLSENAAIEGSVGFNPFIYIVLGPPFQNNIINADIQFRVQANTSKHSFYVASGLFVGSYDVINIIFIAAPKISIGMQGLYKSKIGFELGSTINLSTEISGSETENGLTYHAVQTREKFAGTLFPYFKLKINM